MRKRQRRVIRAFLASLAVASLVAFICHDGPSIEEQSFPALPLAEASNAMMDLWEGAVPKEDPLQELSQLSLPSGFQAQWVQQNLDQGKVQIQALQKVYTIGQTEQGLGSEYFPYAAYLFRQVSRQVKSPTLAKKFNDLSIHAQTLGDTLRQAGHIRFDGIPRSNLRHLEVSNALLSLVRNFNQGNLIQNTYNEKGQMLTQQTPSHFDPGSSLQTFLEEAQALLSDPAAQNYPETVKMAQQHSQWLARVSEHVSLRWDSTRACLSLCDDVIRLKVYATQTLPHNENPNIIATSSFQKDILPAEINGR